MLGFRDYLEGSEEQADIRRTLSKLPLRHRQFVRGYTLSFQGSNTLDNDGKHVGVIQTHPKPHITIASPWRYSRELTMLHEIAHLIWASLSKEQRQAWGDLVRKTPMNDEDRQNDEEMFAMAYGATYSKHPPLTYHKKEWIDFIKKL